MGGCKLNILVMPASVTIRSEQPLPVSETLGIEANPR